LHAKKRRDEAEARRPSASARLYGSEWRKAAREFLEINRWCVGEGIVVDGVKTARCGARATVVDHIQPHKGDLTLFWDRSNWQPLCKRCHDRKTAREDGRWEPKVY
jgi:5-methylcytosine-specific restriction protein A